MDTEINHEAMETKDNEAQNSKNPAEQAAQDYAAECMGGYDPELQDEYNDLMRHFLAGVSWPQRLPKLRWIKASQQLPEEKKDVFIRNGEAMFIASYSNGAWFDDTGFIYLSQSDTERNNIEWLLEETHTQFERFKMPTEEQVLKAALLFNDGKIQPEKLADMVALCDFIIYRLHENGDMTIPSSKEKE